MWVLFDEIFVYDLPDERREQVLVWRVLRGQLPAGQLRRLCGVAGARAVRQLRRSLRRLLRKLEHELHKLQRRVFFERDNLLELLRELDLYELFERQLQPVHAALFELRRACAVAVLDLCGELVISFNLL